MYSMKKLMESSSAMSRFKAQTGFKMSNANSSSSFILINKLKRMLREELTQEKFDEIKYRYFSKNTEVRREIFLDRLVSKIDMFDNDTLKYILEVYTERGLTDTVDTLRLSQVKMRKLVNPLGNQKAKAKELVELDDEQFENFVITHIK